MSQIRAVNLVKSFKGRKVVDHVNFHVESGQVVGLLGPNGAGKTTSFYMVAGLLKCEGGQIFLNDLDLSHDPIYKRARSGLGYLPQEPSVFRKLTVRENILIALEALDLTRDQRKEKVNSLLKDFHIEAIQNEFGFSLSGGERRRVEIARTLAVDPDFILLDEPFAGIDPIAVGDIKTIIRSLKDKGLGILITDHNVRETLSICDYSYILKEGRIEVEGNPEQIVSSEIARRFYLGEDFKL